MIAATQPNPDPRHDATQAESGDATGLGRVLERGTIDVSHGPILYLEDVTCSSTAFAR